LLKTICVNTTYNNEPTDKIKQNAIHIARENDNTDKNILNRDLTS